MPRKSASRAHDSLTSMNPSGAFESPSIRGAAQKRPKPTQPLPSSILGVRWKSKTVRGPGSSESMNPCARGARSLALQETLCRLSVHGHLGSGLKCLKPTNPCGTFGVNNRQGPTKLWRPRPWGVFGASLGPRDLGCILQAFAARDAWGLGTAKCVFK